MLLDQLQQCMNLNQLPLARKLSWHLLFDVHGAALHQKAMYAEEAFAQSSNLQQCQAAAYYADLNPEDSCLFTNMAFLAS